MINLSMILEERKVLGIQVFWNQHWRRHLYPTVFEKAAAIIESLIINHPFIDGNKRRVILAMVTFLFEYNFVLTAGEDELYNFTISISTGETKFDDIIQWLKQNSNQL
ncbi:MAG: type II toxin-antitoxin system death-on-curing family toxin [Chitinophagaceae bacterium]